MDIALNVADNYWNLLKNLSADVKLELIVKLSNSLLSKPHQATSASRFYGVWNDDDFKMSSDELVSKIKEGRKFKNDVEAF